jgi:type IV pilus assembly protein PilA
MTAQPRAKRPTSKQHGFSLVELMTVVLITGILAAIAIPTFSGYVFKSRTSEAVHFLGVIKLKQDAYRSEFGRYAGVGDPTRTDDDSPTDPARIAFVPLAPAQMKGQQEVFPTDNALFNELGARPDGPVRFTYGWAAGTPVTGDIVEAAPWSVPDPADHYFVAQAVSDLNGDGTSCTFEVSSFTRGVWFTPSKGWE